MVSLSLPAVKQLLMGKGYSKQEEADLLTNIHNRAVKWVTTLILILLGSSCLSENRSRHLHFLLIFLGKNFVSHHFCSPQKTWHLIISKGLTTLERVSWLRRSFTTFWRCKTMLTAQEKRFAHWLDIYRECFRCNFRWPKSVPNCRTPRMERSKLSNSWSFRSSVKRRSKQSTRTGLIPQCAQMPIMELFRCDIASYPIQSLIVHLRQR